MEQAKERQREDLILKERQLKEEEKQSEEVRKEDGIIRMGAVRSKREIETLITPLFSEDGQREVEDALSPLNEMKSHFQKWIIRISWPNTYLKVEDEIAVALGKLDQTDAEIKQELRDLGIPPDLKPEFIAILLLEHVLVCQMF